MFIRNIGNIAAGTKLILSTSFNLSLYHFWNHVLPCSAHLLLQDVRTMPCSCPWVFSDTRWCRHQNAGYSYGSYNWQTDTLKDNLTSSFKWGSERESVIQYYWYLVTLFFTLNWNTEDKKQLSSHGRNGQTHRMKTSIQYRLVHMEPSQPETKENGQDSGLHYTVVA